MSTVKAGILTYHFSDNYGAVFQAYATINYLKSLGVDSSIINYEPTYVDRGAGFCFPSSKLKVKKNLITFYQRTINLIDSITGKTRRYQFQKFREQYFNVDYSASFKEHSDFSGLNLDFDLIISGSDQIWNPGINRSPDRVYYSDVSNSARKISYAASYGTASPDFEDLSLVRHCLSGLNDISVREKSAVKLVKDISGLNAQHVPDPTFLIRDYSNLFVKASVPEDYIFSYVLRSGKSIDTVIEKVAKSLNCKVVRAKNYQRPWLNDSNCHDMSPEQWISNIYHSKFIVTNSFHGVALSINLNKPFVAVRLPGSKAALNERVESLLQSLNLTDRIIDANDIDSLIVNVNSQIDWESVNNKLTDFSNIGKEFLNRNLEQAKGR